MQTTEVLVGGAGGNPPPAEAETLLVLDVQSKPQICLLFNNGRCKNHSYLHDP